MTEERALIPVEALIPVDRLPSPGELVGEDIEILIRYRGQTVRIGGGTVERVDVELRNSFREIDSFSGFREYEQTDHVSLDLHFDLKRHR